MSRRLSWVRIPVEWISFTGCMGVGPLVGAGWALVAVMTCATPLRGAEGLYLTWSGCAQDVQATSDRASACNPGDSQSLYCAFTLAQAVDSVVALEIVVDLEAMSATLPAWWEVGKGGCRAGALAPDAEFAQASCAVPWQGLVQGPSVLLAGVFPGEPRGEANQARLKITVAVLPDSFRRLNAGEMYYAARLLLSNDLTAGCSGCQIPTCLVLNSIVIGRLEGAPGGNLLLETPGPMNANRATWQGSGADCAAVAVKRRTWGALKELYR